MNQPAEVLSTTSGDFPLQECRLAVAGRTWAVLHTGAVLTQADETHFLTQLSDRLPYGVALWPSAIALAHEIAVRAAEFHDRTVLELGAGTGLPGIVAASLGARVVQTDRHDVAMSVCRRNGGRNGVASLEHRLADWTKWDDEARYDWVIGSDILYADTLHAPLRRIFDANLAPGGRLLIADPFRDTSFRLLEALEKDGWKVTMTRWTVGEDSTPRSLAVFELAPPRSAGGR
jgi:predicted nicotinamide N-methyase